MTIGMNLRRALAVMCFVLGTLFAALFLLVAFEKIMALSVVAVVALAVYGTTAATLLLAGRALFRRR